MIENLESSFVWLESVIYAPIASINFAAKALAEFFERKYLQRKQMENLISFNKGNLNSEKFFFILFNIASQTKSILVSIYRLSLRILILPSSDLMRNLIFSIIASSVLCAHYLRSILCYVS